MNVFPYINDDGEYFAFYGWGVEPEKFDTLEEVLARIERYFVNDEGEETE